MAKMLKYISPFILSDTDGPSVTLKQQTGEVRAKAFQDAKGRILLLAAGIGPGASKAVIRVNTKKKLKSRYGKTTRLSDGSYRFSGNDICADLVISE